MISPAGWQRWFHIASLMLAGEAIYMLPYMRKTFQTSMEQVFQVGATEIGLLNSMFGVLALACYFPGGWLADRVSARKLLTISLVCTGLGGFYMATLPSYAGLLAVHAFWGVTSILTFWAALIKATRNWGGPDEQGMSFGLLDGGRGLVGAALASLATFAFAVSATTREGLIAVLTVYSAAPLLAGIAVWLVLPETVHERPAAASATASRGEKASRIRRALTMPEVWLLAAVILTAYLLFLGTYEFPAFAERAFGQTKVFGAQLGTFRDWLRPVAAVCAGLLADRIRVTRAVMGAFALLFVTYGSLLLMPTGAGMIRLLWAQVAAAAVAVFALRGIYYALLEESRVPMALTGTAVGIVSVVGYMPDIFAHFLAGWFVDSHPGTLGYQYYFGFLALVALAGLAAALAVHVRTADAGAGKPSEA